MTRTKKIVFGLVEIVIAVFFVVTLQVWARGGITIDEVCADKANGASCGDSKVCAYLIADKGDFVTGGSGKLEITRCITKGQEGYLYTESAKVPCGSPGEQTCASSALACVKLADSTAPTGTTLCLAKSKLSSFIAADVPSASLSAVAVAAVYPACPSGKDTECKAGEYCGTAVTGGNTCTAKAENTGPCLNSRMCKSNFCNTGTNKCEAKVCASGKDSDCDAGFYCAQVNATYQCTAKKAGGIACTPEKATECQSGVCTGGTCTAPQVNPDGTTPDGGLTPQQPTTGTVSLESPVKCDGQPCTYAQMIAKLVDAILALIGLIAVAVVVYGGIMYMTSAGNEERSKMGKAAVTGAVIGLIIVFAAYIIVNFVIRSIGG